MRARVNGRLPLAARFEASHMPVTECGCWLWLGKVDGEGYGSITHRGREWRAHRMAWELAHGALPPGLSVCHRCDVRVCVNPAHLFLGTQGDNVRDCWRKGRGRHAVRRGDGSLPVRLVAAQVRAIRAAGAAGELQATIAKAFGVTTSHVSRILTGRSWGYLP